MVHRTDFFPGLGWMMLRSLWLEYREKWPYGYWDDWMREPEQRKNRACIRPEISRTSVAGSESKNGVSLLVQKLKYNYYILNCVKISNVGVSFLKSF